MLVTKQFLVPIDLFILRKSVGTSNCLVTNMLQNNRRNKLIQVQNDTRVSK